MVRSEKEQASVAAAEAARPKIKLAKAYGMWEAGTVLSLSETRRDFLVSQGIATAAGKEAKEDKKDK